MQCESDEDDFSDDNDNENECNFSDDELIEDVMKLVPLIQDSFHVNSLFYQYVASLRPVNIDSFVIITNVNQALRSTLSTQQTPFSFSGQAFLEFERAFNEAPNTHGESIQKLFEVQPELKDIFVDNLESLESLNFSYSHFKQRQIAEALSSVPIFSPRPHKK